MLRKIIKIINGNGLFPSEKDRYISSMMESYGDKVDDFMRIFSWVIYLEDKYKLYHGDGPMKKYFEDIFKGEPSPFDMLKD